MKFVLALIIVFSSVLPVYAQDDPFRSTGFPIPRFVSVRSDKAFVRTGPGQKYPIQWVYTKSGIPVEVILEYDIWRKIRDFDGQEGWMHKSLLSGRRYGFVRHEEGASVYKKPMQNSGLLAVFQKQVLLRVEECANGWCFVKASAYQGWMQQKYIWGVYESEEFD